MADAETPGVADNLYALTVYLHAGCNRDLLDAIHAEEISLSQLQLLDRLRSGRRRPNVAQAARLIHRSPAGTSRLVDELARRGLIRREGDEGDFRSKRLVITDRGEQVIARLHAARYDQVVAFTEELEPDERDQLQAALVQVLSRNEISQYRPQPVPA